MNKPRRIGVYGGTFDPIHQTHLDIARTALQHAGLDLLLFVVSGSPPHKRGEVFASPEDRLDLVEAAIDDDPRMKTSRIELDRPGPSYTVDTLRILAEEYPDAAFYLILGYDSLIDLPGWHKPEEVLTHAKLLVAPRPGAMPTPNPILDHRFDLLPFSESNLSSTEIRACIAAGTNLSGMLPPAVENLIRERGLYGAAHPSTKL